MSVVPYPRSHYRSELGACGLIGKIHITSDMSVQEVEQEVRSVFTRPMKGSGTFQFMYLQPTGGGNRSLTIPSVSSSYEWTPQQVAKLANARGAIYIMALEDMDLPDMENSCDVSNWFKVLISSYS